MNEMMLMLNELENLKFAESPTLTKGHSSSSDAGD